MYEPRPSPLASALADFRGKHPLRDYVAISTSLFHLFGCWSCFCLCRGISVGILELGSAARIVSAITSARVRHAIYRDAEIGRVVACAAHSVVAINKLPYCLSPDALRADRVFLSLEFAAVGVAWPAVSPAKLICVNTSPLLSSLPFPGHRHQLHRPILTTSSSNHESQPTSTPVHSTHVPTARQRFISLSRRD